MQKKNDSRYLSDSIRQRLLEEIQSGAFLHATRLPPENELAEHFGVSRNMMRECLTQIEREGMINRRRGVGTLINRRVVSADTRLDLVASLDSTLEKIGYKPSTDFIEATQEPAEGEVAKSLELPPGSPLLVVERVTRAGDRPAVHIKDYVSLAGLPKRKFTKRDFMPSIFTFLQKQANIEVYLNLTEIRALPAPPRVADFLQVEPGSPLLFLGEVGFDFGGRPVLYSEEYLIDRIIRHMILRKKI
nr:GntR family transcriptional regulator [uncultured Oscillibacter sp.]